MVPFRSPGKASWLNGIAALVRGGGDAVGEERKYLAAMGSSKLSKMRQPQTPFLQQAWYEIRKFFFGTKLNVLLLVTPVATASKLAGWGDGPTCALSMLALIPLAERLGYVTEQLAGYTNDSVGGLLNATFGNATELIICAFALKANLLRVVQLSLLGSVVSNLLLVLGTAFLAGGIMHPMQTFSRDAIAVHCALLLLAVIAVLLPTMLVATRTQAEIGDNKGWVQDAYPIGSSSLILSRLESLALLGCYALFLFFQLATHKHLYEGADTAPASNQPSRAGSGRPTARREAEMTDMQGQGPSSSTREAQGNNTSRSASGRPSQKRSDEEIDEATVPLVLGAGMFHSSSRGDVEAGSRDTGSATSPHFQSNSNGALGGGSLAVVSSSSGGGEDEEQELSKAGCLFWMALVTVLISLISEWVVNAIEGASLQLNVPLPFLVTILLPIVGNAAEHASAVMFAVRDRVELALGVAVGSATQVSVLLIPFSVTLAWMMGRPLDLNLSPFEAAVLFVSVLLSVVLLQDGSSTWLKGVLLVLTYVFVSAGFWCHQDDTLSKEQGPAAAAGAAAAGRALLQGAAAAATGVGRALLNALG